MNVNVRISKMLFCFVVLLFYLSSVCHAIIHSSFGRLRNGWGIRPANHFYQCDGLKTSGSRFSLEVESVVSSYCLSIALSGYDSLLIALNSFDVFFDFVWLETLLVSGTDYLRGALSQCYCPILVSACL